MKKENAHSSDRRMGRAGITALVILLVESSIAAFWGAVEFFHEGWFEPYGKYLIFYMSPFLVIYCLNLLAVARPVAAGLSIIAISSLFSIWRIARIKSLHYPLSPSAVIMWLILALPGILLIIESLPRKVKAPVPGLQGGRRGHSIRRLRTAVLFIPIIVIIVSGTPLLVRNLNRTPLENYEEAVVEGKGVKLVLAGSGPGWFYSNKKPIRFHGRTYSALSWNEIALFGKEPIGFDGKRYGESYNGTEESIYYATQEDFDRFNMFRYINESGTELTDSVYDCWRLPGIDEYVRVLSRHGENCGGAFDRKSMKATYEKTPDKEGPVWAPEKEVIYYWSSTSMDEKRAFDISYSGRARGVLKTTRQDYRGFRAVKAK